MAAVLLSLALGAGQAGAYVEHQPQWLPDDDDVPAAPAVQQLADATTAWAQSMGLAAERRRVWVTGQQQGHGWAEVRPGQANIYVVPWLHDRLAEAAAGQPRPGAVRVLLHEVLHNRAGWEPHQGTWWPSAEVTADRLWWEEGIVEATTLDLLPHLARALGLTGVTAQPQPVAYPHNVRAVRTHCALATSTRWNSPPARRCRWQLQAEGWAERMPRIRAIHAAHHR